MITGEIPAYLGGNSHIKQWEDASSSLEQAISAYFQSCRNLELSVFTATSISAFGNLPTLLNNRIESFHTSFTQPLAKSFSALARARNKLKTSVNRVPPEILGTIFEFAVSGAIAREALPMDKVVENTWRTLYRILGVCSTWKKVALAHTPLWSLIPMVHRNGHPPFQTINSAQLGLERAGQSSKLYLAIDLQEDPLDWPLPLWESWPECFARFQYVNLRSTCSSAISRTLACLLCRSTFQNIAELSLCVTRSSHKIPQRMGHIFPYDIHSQHSLEQMLSFVRVLRLKSVNILMTNVVFRNLVQLRIQGVMVGRDRDLSRLLSALASASQLRNLEFISVTAYVDLMFIDPAVRDPPIQFPNLRTLFLADLFSNVVHTVLGSIAPGNYRLVFSPSPDCLARMGRLDRVGADTRILEIALHDHKVDTLIMNHSWYPQDRHTTSALLAIMPTITTIYLIGRAISRAELIALTRSGSSVRFPQFRKMYISQSVIEDVGDQNELVDMIVSHGVQELTLHGCSIEAFAEDEEEVEQVDIAGPDMRSAPIKNWLYQTVPKLTLLQRGGSSGFGEFDTEVWRLW